MDLGVARGLITVATFGAFLGICWWAYRAANRERFERDAQLPFAGEGADRSEHMREPS
jgi:cytochrome c oxidase cbb3-type subunit 4